MTTKQIDLAIAGVTEKALPYSSCLNAMHEAEKVLTPQQARVYDMWLHRMPEPCGWIWFTGASGRAEAFLRTLGKWEEAP